MKLAKTSLNPPFSAAHTILRALIVLNWMSGMGIGLLLALLLAIPTRAWMMKALGLPPEPNSQQLFLGFIAIAAIGLITIPLHDLFLKRVLAILDSVREGDPFVAANSLHLRMIGWVLLTLQCLSIVIGAIASAVSTPEHPVHIDAGFSITGWLAVLLTFLLAHVFAAGTTMREEISGTV